MTIKDVPQAMRTQSANRLRERIRDMLSNPFLLADQRQHLQQTLVQVDQWEGGKGAPDQPPALPPVSQPPALPPGPREPQNHVIDVAEGLSVEES